MSTPERFDSTTDLASTGKGGDTKSALLTAILTAIVTSLVGIVLSALAFTRPAPLPVSVVTSGGQTGSAAPGTQHSAGGKRIWRIAYGHDWGAYEYFDDEGSITGFIPEFVQAVCKAGDMDCRMVWDRYTNCWASQAGEHPRGTVGLMSRYYDACSGWSQTVDRIHTYAFSDAFLKVNPTRFFVKKGNAASFQASDLKGRKIAFLDGWGNDEKCLARQQDDQHRNYVLPKDDIIHVAFPEQAVEYLVNGTAYAMLIDLRTMDKFSELEAVPNIVFNCYLSGNSMMTRKDSDFSAYFNIGFQKLKESGNFTKLCEDAKNKHGKQGEISCVD